MKYKKYLIMDCMGNWFWSTLRETIDFDSQQYIIENDDGTIDKFYFSYIEIYKDIPVEGREYRFYAITTQNGDEYFIKIKEK